MHAGAESELAPAVDRSSTVDPLPAKIDVVDGNDIRFRRLSASGIKLALSTDVDSFWIGGIPKGCPHGITFPIAIPRTESRIIQIANSRLARLGLETLRPETSN